MTSPDLCGEPHPTRPGVTCVRSGPCTGGLAHRNGRETWGGYRPEETEPPPAGRDALAGMAVRAERARRTGSAADAVKAWRRAVT
jgi:hypothetical protein